MDPYRKWTSRALVVLVVMNVSLLYANWRLIYQLRSHDTPRVQEVRNAANDALRSQ